MELEGFLQLRSAGGCVELFNSCRTLHYLRESGKGGWQVSDCDDCCCFHHDAGYGAAPNLQPNIAPWVDPNNPGSQDFLGLYGQLTIAQAEASAAGGTTFVQRITFRGLVVATSRRGTNFGCRWVSQQLEPYCGNCRGSQLEMYAFCGQRIVPGLTIPEAENPRPTVGQGYDCDDPTPPEPLGPPPELPRLRTPDSGLRTLLNANYVSNSFVELQDAPLPGCYGKQVTFSFDLTDNVTHTEPDVLCELPPFDECGCVGVTWEVPNDEEDCGRCGLPCVCSTTIVTSSADTASAASLPDGAAECRWSEPLYKTRTSCVTPPVIWDEAVPVITIESGAEFVTNMTVTMWDAHPGLPDPATCVGKEVYDNRGPLAEPLNISIPASSTMTIDGRTGQVTLNCNGQDRPAGELVSTCGGLRITTPVLRCGKRIWVAIDADCMNLPAEDFRATVAMVGRERVG